MNDNAYKTYYFDHKPKSHLLEEIGRGQTRGRGAVVWLYRLHAVLQNAWVCFGHFMHSNKSATFPQNCKEGMFTMFYTVLWYSYDREGYCTVQLSRVGKALSKIWKVFAIR